MNTDGKEPPERIAESRRRDPSLLVTEAQFRKGAAEDEPRQADGAKTE